MKRLTSYATAKRKAAKAVPKRIRKRRMTKGGRGSDPAKVAWLHTLGCCLCGAIPVEVHHDRKPGSRATDAKTIPLCPEHHMGGRYGVGQMGRGRFERWHGVVMDDRTAEYEAYWQLRKARKT